MVKQSLNHFEETLAFHCAPVLLGAKSANLVSFSKKEHPNLLLKLREYSSALKSRDLCFEPVCECGRRVLVLVYRKALLMSELAAPGVAAFLEELGYPGGCPSRDGQFALLLDHLKTRIAACDGFPHEIGLFLGYPLPDVLGFIENQGRDYLLSGYWKVYSDAEQRKLTFARYTACRNYLCKHILNGSRLISILAAA